MSELWTRRECGRERGEEHLEQGTGFRGSTYLNGDCVPREAPAFRPGVVHQKLSRDILVCSEGKLSFTPKQRAFLEERGITITLFDSRLGRVEGIPTGIRLYFADGTGLERTTLSTHGERKLHSELAQDLGCTMSEGGTGIQVEASQATSTPGVYAAGDVSSGNQITFAVAGGAHAATYAADSLFYDDLPNLPANEGTSKEAPGA